MQIEEAECCAAGCSHGEGCSSGHPMTADMAVLGRLSEGLGDLFDLVLPILRPLLGDARTALDRARPGAAERITAFVPRLSAIDRVDADSLLLLLCAEFDLPAPQLPSVPLAQCALCRRLRGRDGGGICAGCG